jgi:hypothetical protein
MQKLFAKNSMPSNSIDSRIPKSSTNKNTAYLAEEIKELLENRKTNQPTSIAQHEDKPSPFSSTNGNELSSKKIKNSRSFMQRYQTLE